MYTKISWVAQGENRYKIRE